MSIHKTHHQPQLTTTDNKLTTQTLNHVTGYSRNQVTKGLSKAITTLLSHHIKLTDLYHGSLVLSPFHYRSLEELFFFCFGIFPFPLSHSLPFLPWDRQLDVEEWYWSLTGKRWQRIITTYHQPPAKLAQRIIPSIPSTTRQMPRP